MPVSLTAVQWFEAVRHEERRGEFLTAFDLADRGLAEHPEDLLLKHRAVLSLARAGATEEAARRFEEYGLDGIEDEDIAALQARIAKDLALASEGKAQRQEAAHAAELYGAVFARTHGYYPAVNAATMRLVAGDVAGSRALATTVLELLAPSRADSYYEAATRAEAYLLLGNEARAVESLARAAQRNPDDYAALATTRRQLRTICRLLGLNVQLLGVLAGPAVVHFCGHRIADADEVGRFARGAEAAVGSAIAEVIARHPSGFAYGSLASGADILWAEALLAAGSELHVVLPFAREEFVARSVASAGAGWVERFERCLAGATTVSYATDDAFLGDDALFRYGTELAMGLAVLRARYLDAELRQLAVWDGGPANGAAGTSIDVATWRRGGHAATFVYPDDDARITESDDRGPSCAPMEDLPAGGLEAPEFLLPGDARRGGRVVRAMLFGDIKGFSKLTDEELPVFASRILGGFAAVLERHTEEVRFRNTWGDAVYVVLSDVAAAAHCALELQETMGAIDLEAEGLPLHLALRIGGHVGPVFPTYDPVLGTDGFMGSHVSRTARIEPVAPPGSVYVTQPFAAALVLDGGSEFVCDYVGHMAAAKDYGHLRMYRLRRGPAADTPSRRSALASGAT
jgi:tetratricopeptide (TPR) repeat protein